MKGQFYRALWATGKSLLDAFRGRTNTAGYKDARTALGTRELGAVESDCNPNIPHGEAGKLRVQDQPGLDTKKKVEEKKEEEEEEEEEN